MIIRTATIKDAKWIATVHTNSRITSYDWIIHKERLDYMNTEEYRQKRLKKWKEILEEQWKDHIFVAIIDWEIVWFAWGGPKREPDTEWDAELYAIYLSSIHKRKWIWKKIFNKVKESLLKDWYSSFGLRTLEKSIESNEFYKKMWWKVFWKKEYEISGKSYVLNGYIFSI